MDTPPQRRPTLRLFVAVDPSAEVVEGIRRALPPLRPMAPSAKWGDPGKLHLTLAFLGSTPVEEVAAIESALASVASAHAPLALGARGAGTFGSPRKPRVLWVGLEGDLDPLAALRHDVVEALVPLGLRREERPFRPHLTVARSRDPRGDRGLAQAREALAAIDLGVFSVGELLLFQSVLHPKGAQYQRLAVFPLGGGATPG